MFLRILNLTAFYILSILALTFLVYVTYIICKKSKVKLNHNEILIIAIAIILTSSIYIYIIKTRQYIYTWDDDIYYNAQITLLEKFKSNFFTGIKEIINTSYRSEYGDFLLVFTTGIFSLTNKSPDSFVILYSIISLIFIYTNFLIIIKKLMEKIKCKRKYYIFGIGMLLLTLFPLLHKSAIMGQPDMIGLIFAEWLIILTIDYDFSYKDLYRWLLILGTTFCLIITRRWYIFFAFGYYLSYLIIILANVIKTKDKENKKIILKNVLYFTLLAVVILGILIIGPMVYRTIRNNYTSTYQAWSTGGLLSEFKAQLYRLGILYVIIIAIGIIYGIENKKTRQFTITIILTWIISIIAFTRIQNMGDHHSLILLPSYFILFMLGVICISNINKKLLAIIGDAWITIIIILNFYGSITENGKIYGNRLFTNISIKPSSRTDMESIKNVVDFIIANCDMDNWAYINAAGEYCRDTFSNYYLPEHLELVQMMPYECSVDSAHGFPVDMLKCKYVFISNIVIEATGATQGHIIPKIADAIQTDPIISKKYQKVEEFVMTDTITFYAYERIEAFTEEEREEWLEIFKEQSELYPTMFKDKIEAFSR